MEEVEKSGGETLDAPWTQLELDQDTSIMVVMLCPEPRSWPSCAAPPPCRGPTGCLAMPGQCGGSAV